jgi:Tfp pilus assembly protein PilZ
LPVGARLLMMLVFPDEPRPLAVRAEVRWSRRAASVADDGRPVGMGVRFVDPPLGVSLSIGELLESERARQ